MKAGTAARYVLRLELTAPCSGRSHASRSAVDLSAVLGHAPSLEELVRDLFLPFERLGGVDQVVALRVELAAGGATSGRLDAGEDGEDSVQSVHRFTSAIAGAMAGAKRCGTPSLDIAFSGYERPCNLLFCHTT